MKAFLRTDIGRGITGIGLSIGIILAVMFPVLFMDLFTKLINFG
jgi:hypothetical protein